jgi:hypothetical protein
MKGGFMKMMTILSILLLTSFTMAEAREPAVEPVTGISIDDYKVIPPSQAKGYDFQKGKPKEVTKKAPVQKSNDRQFAATIPVETKTTQQLGANAPTWPVSIFLFVLIALPFGAWFGIMKSLGQDKEDEYIPSNTIAFPTKSDSTDDDDFNLPKAG